MRNANVDVVAIIVMFLLIVLFAGDPDLHDALIKALTK